MSGGFARPDTSESSAVTQNTRPAPPPTALAALRLALPIVRIGGGYETDVFRSGDGRLAIKIKHLTGPPAAIRARARQLARVAEIFCSYLGPEQSLLGQYLVVASDDGQSHVLAVQPFLNNAHGLHSVDLAARSPEEQVAIARQLDQIVTRALACYRATGYLPDLYGLGPQDSARARRLDLSWMLSEAWRILAGRPLTAAHNLLLRADGKIVLVDYDPIGHRWLSHRLLNGARALLLLRDRCQLAALGRSPASSSPKKR
jgi:hypothetical protein